MIVVNALYQHPVNEVEPVFGPVHISAKAVAGLQPALDGFPKPHPDCTAQVLFANGGAMWVSNSIDYLQFEFIQRGV